MTCTPPIDLDDLQCEIALTPRAELQAVLDDMIDRSPEHELELLRFVVAWLLDDTGPDDVP